MTKLPCQILHRVFFKICIIEVKMDNKHIENLIKMLGSHIQMDLKFNQEIEKIRSH